MGWMMTEKILYFTDEDVSLIEEIKLKEMEVLLVNRENYKSVDIADVSSIVIDTNEFENILMYYKNLEFENILIVARTVEIEEKRKIYEKVFEYGINKILFNPEIADEILFSLHGKTSLKCSLYKQYLDKMNSIAVITNKKHEILYANDAFFKTTLHNKDEIMNKNVSMIKSEHHSLMFYNNLKHTLSAGLNWQGMFHNKKANGTLYWEEASIFPMHTVITVFITEKLRLM